MLARQTVRRLTQELGFGLVDQTKMVTAASELARNAVVYGAAATMLWEMLSRAARAAACGSSSSTRDRASPNLEQAMTDGWTSGKGLGLGLSGAKRLVNEFDIDTGVGRGTRVTITRWK